MKRKIIRTLGLALVGGFFFSNIALAANGTEAEETITTPVIEIADGIEDNITEEALETVIEIAEAKGKDEVSIISCDSITENDILASEEKALFIYDSGKLAGVEINPEIVETISVIAVQDIIQSDEVNDGNYVTISGYAETEDVESSEESEESDMQIGSASTKGYGYVYRNGERKKYGDPQKAEVKYITSVAKGQKKTLSQAVTCTSKLSLGGEYFDGTLIKSGFVLSRTYKSSVTYSSSDMAKGTNCRKFYMRTYKQSYKRKQSKVNAKTNAVISTKTAILKEPAYSTEYSVDVKES